MLADRDLVHGIDFEAYQTPPDDQFGLPSDLEIPDATELMLRKLVGDYKLDRSDPQVEAMLDTIGNLHREHPDNPVVAVRARYHIRTYLARNGLLEV